MKPRLFDVTQLYGKEQREQDRVHALAPVEAFIASVYTHEEMLARKEMVIQSIEDIYLHYSTETPDAEPTDPAAPAPEATPYLG